MAVARRSPYVTFILQHPFPMNGSDSLQLLYPSTESFGAFQLYSHVQVDSSKPISDLFFDYCTLVHGNGNPVFMERHRHLSSVIALAGMSTVEVMNSFKYAIIKHDDDGDLLNDWDHVYTLSELNDGIAVWCPKNIFYAFYLSLSSL